jgi:hypothetical protein
MSNTSDILQICALSAGSAYGIFQSVRYYLKTKEKKTLNTKQLDSIIRDFEKAIAFYDNSAYILLYQERLNLEKKSKNKRPSTDEAQTTIESPFSFAQTMC